MHKIIAVCLIAMLLTSCGVSNTEIKDPASKVITIAYQANAVTLYDIPLSKELQEYTYKTCEEYNIVDYYELVLAMMWQESNFNAKAISATDDYGLMQINICNHHSLSEKLGITDFLDAKQNIKAGTWMISRYLLKYADINKSLMAYNLGTAGAKHYWDAGQYSTTYCEAVNSKLAKLVSAKVQE